MSGSCSRSQLPRVRERVQVALTFSSLSESRPRSRSPSRSRSRSRSLSVHPSLIHPVTIVFRPSARYFALACLSLAPSTSIALLISAISRVPTLARSFPLSLTLQAHSVTSRSSHSLGCVVSKAVLQPTYTLSASHRLHFSFLVRFLHLASF